MRLIDADALSELVGEPIEVFLGRLDLKLPPTVDAVPVIRCKDCVYKNAYGYCTFYINFHHLTADMDYCSDAERKEE